MKKTKNETVIEVQLNVLDEKKIQLQLVQEASSNAVSVFTNAIEEIKNINTDIQARKNEIDSLIEALKSTKVELIETEKANDTIIQKFETLLN